MDALFKSQPLVETLIGVLSKHQLMEESLRRAATEAPEVYDLYLKPVVEWLDSMEKLQATGSLGAGYAKAVTAVVDLAMPGIKSKVQSGVKPEETALHLLLKAQRDANSLLKGRLEIAAMTLPEEEDPVPVLDQEFLQWATTVFPKG